MARPNKKKSQKIIKGIPAAPGIAIGTAFVFGVEDLSPHERTISEKEIPKEIERFHFALKETKKEIIDIEKRISKELGVEQGKIFTAHLLVLDDPVLVEEVVTRLKTKKKNVCFIFAQVLNKYIDVLAGAKDEYLRERISDIADVGKRILRKLLGAENINLDDIDENSVIIAYDLSPSETAMMHKENVIGFATDIGGRTSHTAIMAKSLEIPAVVGLETVTDEIESGDTVILDGMHGVVLINPAESIIKKYKKDKVKIDKLETNLEDLRTLPSTTPDGRNIKIKGNIELVDDVLSVISHGADGVGLYRTEYFYMNRGDLPSEEEQFKAYKTVAERMSPAVVTIRTLDIGGDKFLSQLEIPREMNPFLGWRAIRFCLARPDIFKTQLRAILRASSFGNVNLMYPMISGIGELRQANCLLDEVKKDLKKDKIAFDQNIKVGAMIEVPSAAMTSDIIAKECDFFSIGTNDLIQYALAVDRVNEKIAYLYEPTHPAVLGLIKMVIDSGHKEGIPVALCGEMASDVCMAMMLLGLGLDEFSVSPIAVPEIKKVIRTVNYSVAKEIASKILKMQTGIEIRLFLKQQLIKFVPDLADQFSED